MAGRHPVRVRTATDAAALLRASRRRPVLVFKHSRTCPLSALAWDAWQEFLRDPAARGVEAAYLVVQEDRAAAAALEEALGVRHESPQAILILDGAAAWHASHGAITAGALARAAGAVRQGGGGDGAAG